MSSSPASDDSTAISSLSSCGAEIRSSSPASESSVRVPTRAVWILSSLRRRARLPANGPCTDRIIALARGARPSGSEQSLGGLQQRLTQGDGVGTGETWPKGPTLWLHSGVEIVEFGPLTDALRRELEGDEQDPFDAGGITLHFQPKDRHVGLRDDSGRLVASTGIVLAEVEVDRERFPVVGLGGVIVNAGYRGRGLGRRVVQAALTKARKLGPAFAILFCHDDRAGLYRKLGFTPVDAEVVVWQSAGYAPMPQQTMWRPLHEKREWPTGRVVVHSLPF